MAMKKVRDMAMVEACRELYMKYGGRGHSQIETEMREAGWTTFSRFNLYTASSADGRIRRHGWVDRFGWKKELERRKKRAAARAARKIKKFELWLEADPAKMKWTAKHHIHICEQLAKITGGEVKRLMLFVPPRHGKSELVTVRYAAWRMVREPQINIIIGCYNQSLANRFSRKMQRLVEGSIKLARGKRSAGEWETAAGGSVKAVGVGAGITGFGGDLIIIDDPVKSRAVANSATFREKTWDWYKDDIHTRLEPGAAVILIQTRWHDDDLAGRLLNDMRDGGEEWTVVRLPALAEATIELRNADCEVRNEGAVRTAECEVRSEEKESTTNKREREVPESAEQDPQSDPPTPQSTVPIPQSALRIPQSTDPLGRAEGVALWPERYDRDNLLATKRRLGAWSFAALYQQRPHPEGSTLFKHSWFKNIVSRCPDGLRWARGYDLAVSLKESADYTASFRCALDKRTGTLYIADGFRKRIEYPEQRKFVIERMLAEPDTAHGIELALHGKALVQELRRDPRILGRVLRGVKVDGDKLMRAEAWSSYAEDGKVVLVSGPWIDDFLDEVCRFTGRGDAHDDQVDAVSLAVQMLNRRGKGIKFFD